MDVCQFDGELFYFWLNGPVDKFLFDKLLKQMILINFYSKKLVSAWFRSTPTLIFRIIEK